MRAFERTKRMGKLRATMVIVLALALSGCWTQFRGGPTHTGFQPFEGSINVANVANLTEAWTGTTGGAIWSSPAVVGGVAYVGSDDGHLYAFDAAGVTNCSGTPKSCAPLWTAATGGFARSSPAVVDGIVYVGTASGSVLAFDATGVSGCSGVPKTCSPLWTATVGSSVVSSPTVANGVLYVGGQFGGLYAFDAHGGTGCSGARAGRLTRVAGCRRRYRDSL